MNYFFEKVKYRNIFFYRRRKWYLVPRVSFLRKLEGVGGRGGGGGGGVTIIWIPKLPRTG